jgi:hypothetical protein
MNIMKKLLFTLAILTISFQANAQWWTASKKVNGNGEMTSQTRNVSNYEQVALQGSIDVQLVAGKEGKLTVEAESNLMEYIKTEVSGGKLKIYVEDGVNLSPSRNRDIKVTVPFESIHKVSLTGSGDITSSDRIKSRNFEVHVTGSGDINLDIFAENVKGSVTGSGDIILNGTTTNLHCTVTGSGDFQAYELKAENVKAVVSGSGDIEVSPSEELEASVSGSGDITYNGDPKKQDFKTAGSGSVSKR